jgi:hypothetical protein
MAGTQPDIPTFNLANYRADVPTNQALILQPHEATPQYVAHTAAFRAAVQVTQLLHVHGRVFSSAAEMAAYGRRTYDALHAAWLGRFGVGQHYPAQPDLHPVLLASPTSAHATKYRSYV